MNCGDWDFSGKNKSEIKKGGRGGGGGGGGGFLVN